MAKKIEMLNDQQEVVHPLTSSDCVIMENGKTLEEVMGDGIATPTVTHEGASFQVGVGDSNIEVVDGDVAGMTLDGQTYQNILPKPTTLIMETDEKEFKINDKIDNNIVLDDNVAEIATIKGQTYVNVVQEESASEYVAIDEELNGQSITTTGKPEGYVKNATLEGLTLVNTIQEPSGADATVLELDADIDAQYATIDNTVQGGIHGATLKGQTLVNLIDTENGYGMRFQHDGTVDGDCYTITTMSHGQKVVVNQAPSGWRYFGQEIKLQMLKKSTKYFVCGEFQGISRFQFMQANGLKPISIRGDVINNRYAIIETAGDLDGNITSQCLYGHISLNIDSGSVLMCNDVILVEYQEGMENWDTPYFEGMKSVEVPSVKTTGKNLFDGEYELDKYLKADGTTSSSANWATIKNYIRVKPNTTYTQNIRMNSPVVYVVFYDKNKNIISAEVGTSVTYAYNSATYTTPNNCYYIKTCYDYSSVGNHLFQVEEGSTVTTYEPYKSSVSTILGTNLIIDSEKGRYYHHENGNKVTDGGSRYDSYRANVEGLKRVYVKNAHSNYTFWDANMNFISGVPFVNELARPTNSQGKDGIVKVPSNAKYMRFAYDTIENNGLPCVSEVIALRKIGDVQDELDLETGKLTQRIGETIIDGKDTMFSSNASVDAGFICRQFARDFFKSGSNFISPNLKQTTLLDGNEEGFCFDGWGMYIRLKAENEQDYLNKIKNNPITISGHLKTESVKTVDLSIVDQDNNTVKSIQTHSTLTHVSTSSQGLIPNIIIPSQLKYPTIIKPSTTYTVQLKQTTVNSEFPLTINLGGTTMAVPSTKFTIATPETLTSQDVIFTGKNNVIGEVVITEGDTTGIEYDFFEGMNDVKSPSVKTTGKNLVVKTKKGAQNSNGGIIDSNRGLASIDLIKIKNGSTYILSGYPSPSETYAYALFDKNKNYLNMAWGGLLNPIDGVSYVRPFILYNTDMDLSDAYMQLEEGSTATSYEPYKGITIEQSIDSIPLTSNMFEQNGYSFNSTSLIRGMSLQQIPLFNSDTRIKTKTLIKLKPNSTYTINADMSFSYACFNKYGNYLKAFDFCSTFTTDSETHYIVMNLRYEDNSNITPSTLDSLNLTLQEVTDEIVLRSIGDVKDTLNLTTGEYVQRIGEIIIDGSEGWTLSTDFSSTYNSYYFILNEAYKNKMKCISDKYQVLSRSEDLGINIGIYMGNSQNKIAPFITSDKMTLSEFKEYLSKNPTTVQYQLATPIIKKVNLTNTTKLPSYTSTTHYDTIVPSNSLVPNIKIPSTIDYNVAIKPSTQYTIRANTTSAMSVNLGGSVGTLANGKVTLTTPSTLAHNSLKLGNGKAKEVMVIEGSEIKDNVPFFNGMKNVQMGGIKLVNIARYKSHANGVSVNANKTLFTYTSVSSTASWGNIEFDKSLLKTNTVYTIYLNVVTNNSDRSNAIKISLGNDNDEWVDISNTFTGTFKTTFKTSDKKDEFFGIYFRNPSTSGQQIVIQNPMIIEGDWTHLDEIPFIESEMIIEQPIIGSQGKNLFDMNTLKVKKNYSNQIKSLNGQKVVFTTAGEWSGVSSGWMKLKPNTTYTFGGEKSRNEIKLFYRLRLNNGDVDSAKTAKTFTTQNSGEVIFNFETSVSDNVDNTVSNVYLYEGNISSPSYEPFKHQTLYSNRVIGYEEGCYYGYGTGNKITQTGQCAMLADVEGLSIAYVTDGGSNYSFWDKDMVFISGKGQLDTALGANNKNGFIAVPSNAKYMRFASSINGSTDYTKATVTGELPLRSLPNGVCDSFNLVTGEYVQRIGEVVLDGSQQLSQFNDEGRRYYAFNAPIKTYTQGGRAISDKLLTGEDENWGRRYRVNPANNLAMLCFSLDGYMTKEQANTYLRENPITVQYELATPIVRKIGLTAKGNYKEVGLIPSHYQSESIGVKCIRATTSGIATSYPEAVESSPIFTNDYNVRHYPVDTHGDYQYVVLIGNGIYINIPKNEVSELTTNGCRKWLEQNPIKIGILTKNSASLYSNIQKPIFFNNVKVQFMNDNVDIQPTLTLQSRSRNSYVMDMMKANTKYTLKALNNSSPFTIDGTSYNATTNGTFTSPSTLTNKLMITGQDVQELMIIEGDVTGKNLPYYKGIRSSFDNTNEIEIYSVNKNLFDINNLVRIHPSSHSVVTGNSITFNCEGSFLGCGECWIPTEIGEKYTVSLGRIIGSIGEFSSRLEIRFYNSLPIGTTLPDSVGNALTTRGKITTTAQAKYMRVTISNGRDDVNNEVTITNIQVEKSSSATSYIQHAHNTTIINMPMQLETVEVVKPIIEVGSVNADNGQNSDNINNRRSKDYIPVESNMTLAFMNGNTYRAENVYLYDINKNYISTVYTNGSGDLIIPKDCYFIRFSSGTTNTSDISVIKKQYKPITLNSLPNGVKDELIINRATSSAKLIRRVGKVVLDGSQAFSLHSSTKPEHECNIYWMPMEKVPYAKAMTNNAISDNLPYTDIGDKPSLNFLTSGFCYLKLRKDVELYSWLKQNPITVYYELAEPVVTEISLKGYPYVYKDGSVQLNTEIPHTTKVKYNVNQEHLINGQNETIIRHDKQIDNLYDYIELYLEEEYRMELFRMQLELSL